MGIDYSFVLTLHNERGPDALRELRSSLQSTRETVLTWGSEDIVLPCSIHFKSGSVTLERGKEVVLDTSIWLPHDSDFEGTFAHADRRVGPDGRDEVSAGYIYVGVICGDDYCRITFTAPTTAISLAFENSGLIRSWFLKYGDRTGSLEVLFDSEFETGKCVDLRTSEWRKPIRIGC